MAEQIEIKRRTKPNLGGRPKLEEIIELTPEMMEIARQISMGYFPEEIASKLNCSIERVKRYLENPILIAYTKRLLGGDRIMESDNMRWNLYASIMNWFTRVFTGKEKEVSPSILQGALQLHSRLDPFELLKSMENPQVEELKRKMINPGNKPLPLAEKRESIFEPMDMECKEESNGKIDKEEDN